MATDSAAVCSLAFRISILVHSVLIVPGYFRLAGRKLTENPITFRCQEMQVPWGGCSPAG